MRIKSKVLTSFITAFSLVLSGSVGSASDLSDAEKKYAELKFQYDRDLESANILLPSSIAESQKCVDSFSGSSNPDDVSARDKCQIALSRFQSERQNLTSRLQDSKNELATLESLIQSLKTPVSSGSSSSSNSSASSTGNSAASSSATPLQSPAQTSSPSTESTTEKATSVEAAPNPVASVNPNSSQSNSDSQNVKPLSTAIGTLNSSKSPLHSAVTTSKKRTIICVKGKTIRKITAVKPVCPKGFKLRRN